MGNIIFITYSHFDQHFLPYSSLSIDVLSIINKDKIKYINRFGSDILLAHYVYFHVSVVVV